MASIACLMPKAGSSESLMLPIDRLEYPEADPSEESAGDIASVRRGGSALAARAAMPPALPPTIPVELLSKPGGDLIGLSVTTLAVTPSSVDSSERVPAVRRAPVAAGLAARVAMPPAPLDIGLRDLPSVVLACAALSAELLVTDRPRIVLTPGARVASVPTPDANAVSAKSTLSSCCLLILSS